MARRGAAADAPENTMEAFGRAVHRSGRTVQVWTIDAPEAVRRLADWGVDAIVTNDVGAARRVLEPSDPARGDEDQETGGTGATP